MDPWVRVLVTFFLGGFGVHKFADRQVGMGILYLLTGGIFGIGWLVDTIKAIIYAINAGNTETSSTHNSQTVHAEVCNASAAATPHADCRFYPYETDFVDGASRQYRYEFNFAPNNESSANILWALTGASRYTSHELTPQLNGNEVQLYFNGSLVGTTTFKLDMFEDWMNRGDPIGNLPANISHKVRDEGVSLIVFEKSECVGENNDGDDVEQPLIRIYW